MSDYARPSMTNLPEELGRDILRQILATEPVDYAKAREESAELIARILAEEEKVQNKTD